MLVRHAIAALLLGFAFVEQSARAFFDPPWIAPSSPREGETVSANIRGGVCDSIFEQPGYPQITKQGNAIRILEYGDHRDTVDLCIYPVGTLTAPIGAFPSGDYMLTVDFRYDDYIFGPAIINIGVVPFTVTGVQAATPVPAAGTGTLLAMLLMVIGLVCCVLRSQLRTVLYRRVGAPLLAMVLASIAPDARAFFDPPRITPTEPRAGETVSVNIRDGVCDAIFFHPGYPEITRQGNSVHVREYGDHRDTVDLCIYTIGTLAVPPGVFAPGDYDVTVDFICDDYIFGPTIIDMGVVPFTVTGVQSAAPVPGLGAWAALAILLLVVHSALHCL